MSGYGPYFDEQREIVLRRDGYACSWLGCSRRDHPAAHHVRPRAFGGSDHLRNLRTYCPEHHPKAEAISRWLYGRLGRPGRIPSPIARKPARPPSPTFVQLLGLESLTTKSAPAPIPPAPEPTLAINAIRRVLEQASRRP